METEAAVSLHCLHVMHEFYITATSNYTYSAYKSYTARDFYLCHISVLQ